MARYLEHPRWVVDLVQSQEQAGLLEALEGDDVERVREAAWGLGCLSSSQAIPPLSERLTHDDAGVRQAAAEALGLIGDAEGAPELLPCLKDPEADVRGAAIWALGAIGHAKAIPALVQALGDDEMFMDAYGEREIIGWKAAESLANMGQDALEALVEATTHRSRQVRENAARALGYLEDPRGIDPLRELLKGRSTEVLRAAINALGALRAEAAVPDLIPFLEHKKPELRWSAVLALGQIGDPTVTPHFIRLLEEEDDDIRYLVTGAMQNVSDPQAHIALIACLKERNRVAEGAARALGELRVEVAVDPLLELLDGKSLELKLAAIGALGSIGGPKAREAVGKQLSEPEVEVRAAACVALSRHPCDDSIRRLELILTDTSREVRHQAARALERLTGRTYL